MLVVVALALLVLVAIVALAVDGGSLYAERRKMQNAADAGALAGARELCLNEFSTLTTVTKAADEYAVELNGADGAVVTVSAPVTVTVVATETAQTFFARAIGFDEVEVSARASASCEGPVAGGGLWPLAVAEDVYDRTCTDPKTCIACGELYYAYISDPTISWDNCDFPAVDIQRAPGQNECDVSFLGEAFDSNADGLPDIDKVQHLDSDSRGWLDLQIPLDPYPSFCHENCGEKNVECWIENGHPGPIYVRDCVAGESGNMPALKTPINDECDEIHNLLLFDRECNAGDTLSNWYQCSQNINPGEDYYHISGFGCMRVIGYYNAWFMCGADPDDRKENKAQVVIVQKMCAKDSNGNEMDRYDECTALTPGSGVPVDPEEPIVVKLSE